MSYTLIAALLLPPPVCTEPSHDRLIVQAGRDVCGAALNASGKPRSAGFLPTVCADPRAVYRVDAARKVDLCVPPEASRA
ncbi:hypothetical protein [Novosphingobium sp. Chol11]|uniref:hypothetical protein n=1 Tax=Novosphingobium sp. Chol11 TaxID=1385763 RepID=UPI0025EAE58C|nr:hypothetical protein [Novosphingobium sp. Chol11]